MGESDRTEPAVSDIAALLEENRRLAQRYLELEEASRKRIEKLNSLNDVLKRGDSDMRRLVEEAAFGFIFLNRDLCVVNANRAFCELIGYALPELSGLDFRQFVYVEKLAAFTGFAEAAARDGSARADIDLMDKKGAIVSCRLSAGAWENDKGERQGVYILAVDVSHEVRTAERMQVLRLNAKENEKTREILLDIIGREIRSPANSIMGMVRMLMDTSLDDRQRELVGVVHSSADALAKLVDNLVDMARLESSDVKIRLAPLRVAGLCEGVVGFFSGRAEEKGVNLDVSLAPGVPEAVMGDAGRLRRVLAHLVDNALKFTDSGRVTISVDVLADKLRFMVSDTGQGLYPGAGDEIFGDFAGADSPNQRRYGGVGVGLSICRRLVALMGGKIGFESTPGRGSEFHFTIPLAPVSAQELPAEEDVLQAPAALRLPPLRILAAEANPMGGRMMATVLGLDGHRVVVVDNGLEAAERARSGDFDVMLLDMQMPKLDGFQALKIIRDDEQASGRPRVPAIALVAAALAKSAEFYEREGFDGVAARPVNPADLMEAIRAATGVEPLAVAAPAASSAYGAERGGSSIRRIDGRQFAIIREIMLDDQFVGVLRVFIEDSVPDVIRIVDMSAEPEPDRERIVFIANKARGMAGYLGLSALSDILGAMEREGREGTSGKTLKELGGELQVVMDDTLEELKRIAPHVFTTMTVVDRTNPNLERPNHA